MSRVNPCKALEMWRTLVVPELAKPKPAQVNELLKCICKGNDQIIAQLGELQQAIFAAQQQGARPAQTRGMTQITISFFTMAGATVTPIMPADPMRRMFLIGQAATDAFYSPTTEQLDAFIGLHVPRFNLDNIEAGLFVTEEKYGQLVQYPWFGNSQMPLGTNVILIQERYIDATKANPVWYQPADLGQTAQQDERTKAVTKEPEPTEAPALAAAEPIAFSERTLYP